MNKHYFNSIEEAEKFIKANNITGYHFETPEYLEDGVDLVIHKTFIYDNKYGLLLFCYLYYIL